MRNGSEHFHREPDGDGKRESLYGGFLLYSGERSKEACERGKESDSYCVESSTRVGMVALSSLPGSCFLVLAPLA